MCVYVTQCQRTVCVFCLYFARFYHVAMYRKDSRYWSADDVQTNANIAPAIRNDETMMSVIATSFIDSSKLSVPAE